jgi:acyl carrier protein
MRSPDSTVEEIVGAVLDLPAGQVGDETSPETTARWDSLQHLNIVMALEESFDVSFTADEIIQMLSVGLIKSVLAEKAARS